MSRIKIIAGILCGLFAGVATPAFAADAKKKPRGHDVNSTAAIPRESFPVPSERKRETAEPLRMRIPMPTTQDQDYNRKVLSDKIEQCEDHWKILADPFAKTPESSRSLMREVNAMNAERLSSAGLSPGPCLKQPGL